MKNATLTLAASTALAFSAGLAAQGLEEIVVTAQKRAENIQDVPISVAAISGDMVEKSQATSLRNLQGLVPNLQINNFPNTPNSAVFTIRGVGVIEPDPFAGNTVSIVQDGVPQYFNMGALLDLFDVESIEVLRGPQGTLFGANTTGGVVNVRTRQPTGEFGGRAEATLGNWDRQDIKAVVDFPIVANVLAGKVAVMNHQRDGWVKNIVDGSDLDSRDVTVLRGALKLTPEGMPDFDVTLATEYAESRNGAPAISNGSRPGDLFYAPEGTLFPGADRAMYENPCPGNPLTTSCSAPDDYYAGSTVPDRNDMDTYRATLTANWYNTGIGDVVSITGYKKFDIHEFTDNDGTPLFGIDTNRRTEGWQLSQELRTAFDVTDRWNMQVGGFYLQTNYEHAADLTLEFALPGLSGLNTQEQDNWSGSVFVQNYFDVSDKLRLQAGVRYTSEYTEMTAGDFGFLNLDGPAQWGVGPQIYGFEVREDERWDELGWKLGLDYRIDEEVMLYGYYARGFKSGGFVGRINAPAAIGPYDPETIDTFEAGMKGDFLDSRLRANLAAFYMIYEDMQLAQNFLLESGSPVGTTIYNVAESNIWGAELELTGLVTERFSVTSSMAYLHAEYEDFITTDGVDLSGKRLQNAPEFSATLGLDYQFPVADGVAEASLLYRHTGEKYLQNLANPAIVKIQATDLVNANIRWTPPSESWSIELWANNLLDKRYIDSVTWNPGLFTQVFYQPPREYGVTFRLNW
ncbi:MAG: TonB-dependent receptor [Pseudomonadota bacterium]|nr:TonB-dependent receptor [Pseudomonadota bacterium]